MGILELRKQMRLVSEVLIKDAWFLHEQLKRLNELHRDSNLVDDVIDRVVGGLDGKNKLPDHSIVSGANVNKKDKDGGMLRVIQMHGPAGKGRGVVS